MNLDVAIEGRIAILQAKVTFAAAEQGHEDLAEVDANLLEGGHEQLARGGVDLLDGLKQ